MNIQITTQSITRALLAVAMLTAGADVSANRIGYDAMDHHGGMTGAPGSHAHDAGRHNGPGDVYGGDGWPGDNIPHFGSASYGGWVSSNDTGRHDWTAPGNPGQVGEGYLHRSYGHPHHTGFPGEEGWHGDYPGDHGRHCHVPQPSVVPLPTTLLLSLSGLFGMVAIARRGRKPSLKISTSP